MSTQDPYTQVPGDDARGGYAPQHGYAAPPGYGAQPGYAAPPGYGAQPGYSPEQGYAPAAAYAQPYAPYGAPAPSGASEGVDGVSIAALVAGLLGTGPVAIILGGLGLRRTADGRRGGTAMAWVGLIAGILATIGWTIAGTAMVMAADEITASVSEFVELSDATYGDDPDLDAYWDACADGDMGACDVLYEESPLGSEYERFGDTCGDRGRPEDQFWCEG